VDEKSRSKNGKMKFLKKQFIVVLVVIFLASFFVFPKPTSASDVSAGTLIYLTNRARAQKGLSQLAQNSKLFKAATLKSEDMLQKNYFAHTSPEGLNSWHWFGIVGYSYRVAGENLAIDFSSSESLFSAWMNSPSHADNILDPRFTDIGIAAVSGEFEGHQAIAVTQMFGQPLVQNRQPQNSIQVNNIDNKTKNDNQNIEQVPSIVQKNEQANSEQPKISTDNYLNQLWSFWNEICDKTKIFPILGFINDSVIIASHIW